MSEKVDIFSFLKKVDNSDFYYYSGLTDDQKKSLSLVVAARWMSCTKNTKQVLAVNALVNPFTFKYSSKHPELLYKLMLIASSGTEKNYNWVGKKKRTSTKPVSAQVVAEYYGISSAKADEYLTNFSLDDVLECAESLAYDDKQIKKIKNEFK